MTFRNAMKLGGVDLGFRLKGGGTNSHDPASMRMKGSVAQVREDATFLGMLLIHTIAGFSNVIRCLRSVAEEVWYRGGVESDAASIVRNRAVMGSRIPVGIAFECGSPTGMGSVGMVRTGELHKKMKRIFLLAVPIGGLAFRQGNSNAQRPAELHFTVTEHGIVPSSVKVFPGPVEIRILSRVRLRKESSTTVTRDAVPGVSPSASIQESPVKREQKKDVLSQVVLTPGTYTLRFGGLDEFSAKITVVAR